MYSVLQAKCEQSLFFLLSSSGSGKDIAKASEIGTARNLGKTDPKTMPGGRLAKIRGVIKIFSNRIGGHQE